MLQKRWAAVDDAVPDGARCRHPGLGEKATDAGDCFGMIGDGRGLGNQFTVARIGCGESALMGAYRLGLT